jgi:hypothetical protein
VVVDVSLNISSTDLSLPSVPLLQRKKYTAKHTSSQPVDRIASVDYGLDTHCNRDLESFSNSSDPLHVPFCHHYDVEMAILGKGLATHIEF